MTTTKKDIMTSKDRDELRKAIDRQVREYLESGGVITNCNHKATTPKEGSLPKFNSVIAHDSLTDPFSRTIGAKNPKQVDP